MILDIFPFSVRFMLAFALSGVIVIPVFTALFRLSGMPVRTGLRLISTAYLLATLIGCVVVYFAFRGAQ
jgi:hypothetical protein